MRWSDENGMTHWIVHPEDHGGDSDMTYCWRTVNWGTPKLYNPPVTCILCIVYADNVAKLPKR